MYREANNSIYRLVVVVWLTLSVSSCVFAAVTWFQLSRRLAESRESAAIHRELDGMARLLLDTETGQRGFALTGEEAFLEPLTTGNTNLPANFERLLELAKADSDMLSLTMELRAEAALKLQFNAKVIETRRSQGIDAAAALVASGDGKRSMDRIRRLMDRIRSMRSHSIADATVEEQGQMTRALFTDLVTGIISIGAGVFAFFLARVAMQHQAREKQLVEAKLQAERSSQEKTVFLANMSHEIRTPMNAILGFSELLDDDLREPKHRQYVQSIRTSAGSLLQLINDILDMSKIEAGVMELRLEPTDPREICDFLHTVFSEPAAKKGVKLECKIAEDLPHALLMDRIRLRQVMVNLVGNAVKFTDHGNICVRVQWEKQETSSHITLLIEVQDTGVGIPKDKLEAIFKPFVQAGAHREKEKAGTGLGLSIVRRLTEMMGGTVTAASVMGQGSAFSLRFPDVAISARLATGEKLESGSSADFNELRPASLLVVDDNETNCQLVAGMFTGSHHRLVFGSNGREAVNKARDLKPEVILLDIRMPGMDGREALTEIRKIPGHELTPIIAVTASSLMSEETELKARFSGYVRKPFSKRELFDELAQFLPRQAKNAPASPPSDSDTTILNVPPELAAELRRLLDAEWPALRDTLAVNETKAFAAKLQSLNERWPCAPLATYAQALARHADNYSVVDMEKHLFEYPVLVERLKHGTSK
jgi:signal transduction histidine kinase/DNA-binding NarL/FixJ family response regulator